MTQALADSRAAITRFGWGRIGVLALAVFQTVLALTLPVAGPFSIDEITYSEMTRSLTEGFGFFIDNGYDQVASPELSTRFVSPSDNGRLASQYPYGLPLIAGIPYALFGVRGIMLVNALAFVAVATFTYLMARQLLQSRWIAWASVGVLTVSTYLWEYSIAIWPHMATAALGLGSIWALLAAADKGSGRQRMYGLVSGLLFGLAVLNRLDAILLLPVIGLTILIEERWRTTALPFVAGLLPTAAVLCSSNWQRWGTLLPFSYGGKVSDWLLPLVALGLGTLAAVAAVIYAVRRLRPSPRFATVVAVVFTAIIMLVPRTRQFIIDWATGVWTLVVDLRTYRITDESALQRLPDGSLIYFGTIKKALLQSAPFLLTGIVPVVAYWRTKERRIAIWLCTPIVTYVGFYSLRAWHGGLSFNLRYFIALLPFAAILTAWSLRIIVDRIESPGRIARYTAAATLAVFALARLAVSSLEGTAWVVSNGPLLIALGVAVSCAALLAGESDTKARLALVSVVAGLTWASAIAFGYDAAATMNVRNSHVGVSTAVAGMMEGDSLLVAGWPDNTYGVKDHLGNVVIALPVNDDFATVDEVIEAFTPARSVYGAMSAADWEAMPDTSVGNWTEVGVVADYSVRQLVPTQ